MRICDSINGCRRMGDPPGRPYDEGRGMVVTRWSGRIVRSFRAR